MKTFMLRKEDVDRSWYSVDVKNKVLGRIASAIALKLMGKGKVNYTPHVDGGDFVVVTNADAVVVSGKKSRDKIYYRHSGYPGNLKETNFQKLIQDKPERVISLAVKRMLPKNKLGSQMLKRLKVYAGGEHPHMPQKPTDLLV